MTDKRILDILDASKDRNTPFSDLRSALNKLGFTCRVKGDHFTNPEGAFMKLRNQKCKVYAKEIVPQEAVKEINAIYM
jgi:hypothetical protein